MSSPEEFRQHHVDWFCCSPEPTLVTFLLSACRSVDVESATYLNEERLLLRESQRDRQCYGSGGRGVHADSGLQDHHLRFVLRRGVFILHKHVPYLSVPLIFIVPPQ